MQEIGKAIRLWLAEVQAPESFYGTLLAELWAGVAGEQLARNTRPGSLQAGTLTVFVRNTYWKTHLAGMEGEICRRAGSVLPAGVIREVSLVTSSRHFQAAAPTAAESRPISPELLRWAADCARPIENPRLRELFRRALLSCLERGGVP
jgi:hypothetical protein